MSSYVTGNYRTNYYSTQERRRRENVQRDNNNAITRIRNQIQQLQSDPLSKFVSSDLANINQRLNALNNSSIENAYSVRDSIRWIQQDANQIRPKAVRLHQIDEENKRRLAEEARIRAEQKLEADREQAWTKAVDNWTDKLSRNLASLKLSEMRVQAKNERWSPDRITAEISALKQNYDHQAQQAQQQIDQQIQQESERQQREAALQKLNALGSSKDEAAKLATKIQQASGSDLAQAIDAADKLEDKTTIDENVRREVVIAVMNSLQSAGFAVAAPTIFNNEKGESIVLVQAANPAGNQSRFAISANGTMEYKFDNYRGKACKADINKVLPILSDVYGVNLSNERVLWENPDDELDEAKPITPMHSTSQG